MIDLQGKIALVTGASRGIGRGIVLELAKTGVTVLINYKNNDEKAKETLELINNLGGYGELVKGDVSSFDGAKEIIDFIINRFGKLDILVNNAGISKIGLFMDSTKEDFDEILDTNLKGAMYLSKHALGPMVSRGSGNIINISSMWGEVGASCEVLYSASKGGINIFTKALAKEVASMGVRVNAIAPGVINTEMNSFLSKEEREELENEIPMGRYGDVSEIGRAVVFLCDENCSYLTGQILRIDGGLI